MRLALITRIAISGWIGINMAPQLTSPPPMQDKAPGKHATYHAAFDVARGSLNQGEEPDRILRGLVMAAYVFHHATCPHQAETRKTEFLKLAAEMADSFEGVIRPN